MAHTKDKQAKLKEERPPKKVLKPCATRHWEQQAAPKTVKKGPRARSSKEVKGVGLSPAKAVAGAVGDGDGDGDGDEIDYVVNNSCEEGICEPPCEDGCGCPCHH